MGIFITKIDLEKIEETNEKIVMQNASICTKMKIESIFWFYALKNDMHTLSLVVGIDNAKMANILIEKRLVFDYTLYKYIRYNSGYTIK